jgi:hypothetical protein
MLNSPKMMLNSTVYNIIPRLRGILIILNKYNRIEIVTMLRARMLLNSITGKFITSRIRPTITIITVAA